MKPTLSILLIFLAFAGCNASEGIQPSGYSSTTPVPVGWNPTPQPPTVGWNPPPVAAAVPPTYAPVKAPSPWENEQDILAAGQVKEEPKVGAGVFTKIVPPVAPPQIFVSTRPAAGAEGHQISINHNHQEEYTSTLDVKTTFNQPAPSFVIRQPSSWVAPQPPIAPVAPVRAGSGRLPPVDQSVFVSQGQGNRFTSFYEPTQPTYAPRYSFATCSPPRHVLNFNWDSPAYRNGAVETFFTPLSYAGTFNRFHQAITGLNLRQSDVPEDVCLTTALNWNDLSAVVTTFGKNKKNYRCSFLEGRQKFALECVPVDQQGEAFRSYFTKSDDRTYLVAYHCWEGGAVEWFAFSNAKLLPQGLKREILEHVQTLGFNSNDYREANYQRCFPDQIPVAENYCVPEHLVQEKNWYPTGAFNPQNEVLYIPMAHVNAYNKLNKIINGEDLRSAHNLNNFCIKSKASLDVRSSALSAFNGVTPFTCAVIPNFFRSNRNPWVESCGTDFNNELFTLFVTKTDGRTYRVAKQCWKTGETTWTVYSTQPTLPRHVRQEILEHVASLGFDARDTQEINYDYCRSGSISPPPAFPPAFPPALTINENEQEVLPGGYFPAPSPFSKCTPPPAKFIKDFFYDSALYQLRRKEEFYMPLAGKGAASSISEFINGYLASSLEISRKGFCSKYELDYRNYDTRFLASTDQSGRMERLNCKLLKNERTGQNLHAMDCFRENGEPVFRHYVTMTDYQNYIVTKHCWASGPTTWVMYSAQPEVTAELKQKVLAHVQELGFNPRLHNEISYRSCPGEAHLHKEESETEIETDALGSATALFPRCTPPNSFLRRHTWESASNNEGIEFFDVAMAHPKIADLYKQSLGQNLNTNNNYFSSQEPNCLRFRMNHNSNISRHIGFGDAVSSDFTCTYAANQEWILECVSKTSPWLSYRNYAIKSDNLSWILNYQCLTSGAVPAAWTLWVAPGTTLTQNTKSGILRTVESLGFNRNDFVEFGSDRCVYRNRMYTQRTCDCCTEANARYI